MRGPNTAFARWRVHHRPSRGAADPPGQAGLPARLRKRDTCDGTTAHRAVPPHRLSQENGCRSSQTDKADTLHSRSREQVAGGRTGPGVASSPPAGWRPGRLPPGGGRPGSSLATHDGLDEPAPTRWAAGGAGSHVIACHRRPAQPRRRASLPAPRRTPRAIAPPGGPRAGGRGTHLGKPRTTLLVQRSWKGRGPRRGCGRAAAASDPTARCHDADAQAHHRGDRPAALAAQQSRTNALRWPAPARHTHALTRTSRCAAGTAAALLARLQSSQTAPGRAANRSLAETPRGSLPAPMVWRATSAAGNRLTSCSFVLHAPTWRGRRCLLRVASGDLESLPACLRQPSAAALLGHRWRKHRLLPAPESRCEAPEPA